MNHRFLFLRISYSWRVVAVGLIAAYLAAFSPFLAAQAQSQAQTPTSTVVAPSPAVQPAQCLAFAFNAPAGVSLKTEWLAADKGLPAHCKVNGKMAERVGVNGKGQPQPYHIGFELRLPLDWNGRLLYQGGGGNDGVVRPALGPQATANQPALARGFAVVTTDGGHQDPSADHGFDPQARIDQAYNAHDKVAGMARQLIQSYFSKAPDKSYFIGCSGGGRQGMMFTQRFPQYFDGVLAIAPAMRVSKGATIAAMWETQLYQAIAPKNDKGEPILSQAYTDDDLATVRRGILTQCDALDGAVDGIVADAAACKFDLSKLQCTGAKDNTCLSTAQVSTLQKVMAGVRNSQGQALYDAWPWDAGIGHKANDWRNWKLGTSTTAAPNSRHVFLMQDALQGRFVTPPDRSLTAFNFNVDTDPPRMDAHSAIYNTADDANLTAFKARGGKLILAHGMADPIFSAFESEAYFKRLQASGGQNMSRYFQIPGMGHCQGGAATDRWDGLAALVDWVEKGQAPEVIPASGSTVFPSRTRPLCAYPKVARYKGSGSLEDGSNFECK